MPDETASSGPSDAAAPGRGARRVWAGASLAFWLLVFGSVLAHAPWGVRLLGFAWAALAFAAPGWGLASVAAAVPFFGNNPGGPHALYLIELALMGFAARDLAERAFGTRRARPTALGPFIWIFFALSTVALIPQWRHLACEFRLYGARAVFNVYQHYATAPIFGLRMWLDLALALRLAAALRDAPLGPGARILFWRALLAACAGAAAAGLADYFGLFSLAFWRGENPDISRFGYRRLQSLFWHSGWFAQYVSAAAPAALAFALAGSRAGGREVFPRPALFALAGMLGVTQLLTFQRGGWIAFASASIAVLAAALLARGEPARRRKLVVGAFGAAAGAALVVVALAAAIPALEHRLLEIARFGDRSKLWGVGLELAMLDPWTGVGLGNYASWHLLRYPEGHPNFYLDKVTPHSAFIHVFAERGALALAAFCTLLFGLLASSAKRAVAAPEAAGAREGSIPGEALALFGGFAGLAVNGVFQDLAYVRVIDLIFWSYAGLLLSYLAADAERAGESRASRLAPRAWLIAGALACAAVLARNREHFAPYLIFGSDNKGYRTAGLRAEVALPPGAARVKVPVLCIDPDVRSAPVVFEFHLAGRKLAAETFNLGGPREVTLDLPAGRDPNAPLVILASRAWSPYGYGLVRLPVCRLGVAYRAAEDANAAAPAGR